MRMRPTAGNFPLQRFVAVSQKCWMQHAGKTGTLLVGVRGVEGDVQRTLFVASAFRYPGAGVTGGDRVSLETCTCERHPQSR